MSRTKHFLPEDDLEQIADQADGPLRHLDGARIFITGGTGFFGIWFLEALSWACETRDLDLSITVLSRNPDSFCQCFPHLATNPKLGFLAGDVRTFTFPDGRFDFVIHGAASVHAGATGDRLASTETMIDSSRRVLDLARASGARSFLLLSSGAVYGSQSVDRVSEEHVGSLDPMQPSSVYGLGKLMREHLAAPWHRESGVPVKIAWLLAILLRGVVCRPYNVGSENEVTIEALARLISDASPGHPPVVACDGATGRPGRYVPSTARIRQELACRQTVALGDAVARMRSWLSAERAKMASWRTA